MRKLKLQMQLTMDGFVAGPNREMDWIYFPWSDDIIKYVQEITEPVDTIILGRKLAEGFIPYWEKVLEDPEDPDFEGGLKYTLTPKVVFSKTIQQSIWNNTTVANGDLVDAIKQLKRQPGDDIIVFGGVNFVASLIKERLIDEFHFFINPTAIGNGMSIFNNIEKPLNFSLKLVKTFDCGIILTYYELDN